MKNGLLENPIVYSKCFKTIDLSIGMPAGDFRMLPVLSHGENHYSTWHVFGKLGLFNAYL